jgi:hypothetical protein
MSSCFGWGGGGEGRGVLFCFITEMLKFLIGHCRIAQSASGFQLGLRKQTESRFHDERF